MAKHFFIVGAQRSGTTYLYNLLAQHPEIEMAAPVRPEPKFFVNDEKYFRGIPWYLSTYFGSKPAASLLGEKSTSYIESEVAAERIARHFPDSKILFMLRNPITRAISNYRFSAANGFEQLTIDQAFLKEQERISSYDPALVSASPFAYLKRGQYSEYIKKYLEHFRKDQIKVMVTESLTGSVDLIADLYNFLGVDSSFVPGEIGKPVNASNAVTYPGDDIAFAMMKQFAHEFDESNQWLSREFDLNLDAWDSPR